MRVRPVFWLVLALSCMGVLIFAGLSQQRAPLRVQITRQHLVSRGLASMEVLLTDPQGLPINQANVVPSAHMTNMNMSTYEVHVQPRGNGSYLLQLQFMMAGPWAITIQASAQGFAPLEHTMQVKVT